ncbi:MAG: hypothetical protein M1385_01480 [Candidatus Marsarchaeota archaeon]|nr:hypothetical protein [Candidatus Marsarchaeota archaeon]
MPTKKEHITFDDIYVKYQDNLLDYILLGALLLISVIIVDTILSVITAIPMFIFSAINPLNTTASLFSYLISIIIHIISPLVLILLITSSKYLKKEGSDLVFALSDGWKDLISSKFIYTIITAIIIASILSVIGGFFGAIIYGVIIAIIIGMSMVKYLTKENPNTFITVFHKIYDKDNTSGVILYLIVLLQLIPVVNAITFFLIPIGVLVLMYTN